MQQSWDKVWAEMKKAFLANPVMKQQIDKSISQAKG